MKPEITIEFSITGTRLDPERITALIGIVPTRTWMIGESIQKTSLRRKHNGWCLSVDNVDDAENNLDLSVAVKRLLHILMPKAGDIKRICSEFELISELSCGVYIKDETPIINFTPDIMSDIAELKAILDIDIIIMS